MPVANSAAAAGGHAAGTAPAIGVPAPRSPALAAGAPVSPALSGQPSPSPQAAMASPHGAAPMPGPYQGGPAYGVPVRPRHPGLAPGGISPQDMRRVQGGMPVRGGAMPVAVMPLHAAPPAYQVCVTALQPVPSVKIASPPCRLHAEGRAF